MMDWFGQASAPYYFMKRTYEPTHIALDLERLLWRAGETIDLNAKIINASTAYPDVKVSISVLDDQFKQLFNNDQFSDIKKGTSVAHEKLGSYSIPDNYRDRFLFIIVELKDNNNNLLSRSVYYPRVLSMLDNPVFYKKYIGEPIPWITLENGPWLKSTVSLTTTSLDIRVVSHIKDKNGNNKVKLKIKNTGDTPAFMTKIDVVGAKRTFFATDNYFWMNPGEERTIALTLRFREDIINKNIALKISALNAKSISIFI